MSNVHDYLKHLSNIDILGEHAETLFTLHVCERPLWLHTAHTINFDQPVHKAKVLDYKSLFANRVLSYLYERDLVFLPAEGCQLEPSQSNLTHFITQETM